MTIYDIAEKAGVSASTVSRIINNKPGVKAETREKIRKLLEEYNYTPDENARGLVKKATKLIGILLADIRNDHHSALAYVVERKLREYGYCSIILNAGYEPEMMAESIQVLEQRKVEGIILVGSTFQNAVVEKKLKESILNIPVVLANGYLDLTNVYGILVDEMSGVRQLVELLYSKGKRNIAFIVSLGTLSSYKKLEGYKEGLKKYNLLEQKVIMEVGMEKEAGYTGCKKLLEKYPYIDGIICAEDLMAVGAIRFLNESNVKIPKQIAVSGINNSIYGESCYPSITTLDNKMPETGLMAAETLIESLKGIDRPHKIMLFPTIIEREST